MTSINWSLLSGAADPGAAFTAGYTRSRAQSALGALARDPSNRDALAILYEVDPASASRMETAGRERTEWEQKQNAIGAQRAYIASRYGGAPGGGGTLSTASPPTIDALGGMNQPSARSAVNMLGAPGGLSQTAPAFPVNALPTAGASAAVTDQPWLNYAMVDPAGAMKARQDETDLLSTRMKLNKADLEAHAAVNAEGLRLLNGVTDQATYDRARADAERLYARYGYDFPDLPAEFNPELVKALQARTLEYKDAIAADLAERRFGWQQQDDRLDNARADRSEGRQEYYRARSDRRSERQDRRAAVRFGERALDRAALSGRVSPDTDDLDAIYGKQ